MRLKKRQLALLLFLILGTIYVAMDKRSSECGEKNNVYKITEPVFGTVMNVTYIATEDLHDTIMTCLKTVDASLSMFNPQSTLARINRGETDSIDSHLSKLLPLAHNISQATDGAFDITVAPLVNAWGFGFKHGNLPTDEQIDSLVALVDYKSISIQGGRIDKSIPGSVIDLSAIAKGYGTDQVAELLAEHNVENFLAEIGGEIVSHGTNPKGKPWHIGINKPEEDSTGNNNEVMEVLEVNNKAMATSGNYRNFYVTDDGRKVAHTINPRNGRPAQHSLLSATVLAPSCAMADAYATAFMVMGMDNAKALLQKHQELQAYFIYADSTGNYRTWNNIKSEK